MTDDGQAITEMIGELTLADKNEILYRLFSELLARNQSPLTEPHVEPHLGETAPGPPAALGELCCPYCGNTKPAATYLENESGRMPWGASDSPGAPQMCSQCKQRGTWQQRPTGSNGKLPGEASLHQEAPAGEAATTASRPSMNCNGTHRFQAVSRYHKEQVAGTETTENPQGLHRVVLDEVSTWACRDCGEETNTPPLQEVTSEVDCAASAL